MTDTIDHEDTPATGSMLSKREPKGWNDHLMAVVLLAVLVTGEIAAAELAYYTRGAIINVVMMMATGLNIIPVILYGARLRRSALIAALALAALLIPRTLIDATQLARLHHEAAAIVDYSYRMRLATGHYPGNLAGYSFHHPELRSVIDYRSDSTTGGFGVYYQVGGNGTEYWYDAGSGWHYYDD